MPEHCPMYYWIDHARLKALPVPTREPSFLDNPRTPDAIKTSVTKLRLCAPKAPCSPSSSAGESGVAGERTVHVTHSPTPAELVAALRGAPSRAAVVRVQHVQWLGSVENDEASSFSSSLTAATRGFWCTACPVTRRGAVISEINTSEVREMETFCKTEARGRLGMGPKMASCCPHGQRLPCHTCSPWERRSVNESDLRWPFDHWIPLLAKLDLPRAGAGAGGMWPVCKHPLCTGADRKRFP